MRGARCDFVTGDRREESRDAHATGGLPEIGVVVMIGRDRQFESFTGQRQHPFIDGGVAVAAVSQGVYVWVATNQAGGQHLASNGEVERPRFAFDHMNLLMQ